MHNHSPKGKSHYSISYWSFVNFDETKSINYLRAVPWDLIKLFDETDDILEAWTDLFYKWLTKTYQ